MPADGVCAPLDLGNEGGPKTWALAFVELRRVVQLALGQIVESSIRRSLQTAARITEHVRSGSPMIRGWIPRSISAFRFFGPELGVLFFRERFQAFQKSLRKMGPS